MKIIQASFRSCIIASIFLGLGSIALAQRTYAMADQKWSYPQIGSFEAKAFYPLMRRAAAHYQDQKFKAAELRMPQSNPGEREGLLYGR